MLQALALHLKVFKDTLDFSKIDVRNIQQFTPNYILSIVQKNKSNDNVKKLTFIGNMLPENVYQALQAPSTPLACFLNSMFNISEDLPEDEREFTLKVAENIQCYPEWGYYLKHANAPLAKHI